MTRLRRAAALVLPWITLPAALYVAFLPLADTTVPVRRMMAVGVAGALLMALPGGVLHLLETRGRRETAVRLLALLLGAVVLLATTSGVGVWAPVAAAAMQASAYGYGRRVAGALRLDDGQAAAWQGVPLRIAMGWAVLLIAFIVTATAGMFVRLVVGGIYLAGLLLAVAPIRRVVNQTPGASTVWWWSLSVLLLVGFVGAVAPEVRHDALTAHLPIAREFAARHAAVEMRQNTASYFQIDADLLHATAMTWVSDERLPKLMHYAAGVVTCALIYDLGARLWNPGAGMIAAAVFAGAPLTWWLAGSAYVDLWTSLFGAGAVAATFLYRRQPGPAGAFAVGLFAGAATGVKIPSVVLVVLLVLVVLSRARTAGRWWATAAALAAGGALTGAFPYVRAWALTGNPVFPFLRGLFGPPGGFLDAQVLQRLTGTGASLGEFIWLPWRITRYPERFVEDGSLGIAYLALLPLTLLAVVRRVPGWISVTAAACLFIWFRTSQYLRFLMPMLPLLVLTIGAGAVAGPGGKRVKRPAVVITVVSLALNAGAWASPGAPNFPHGVAAGRLTRFEYSAEHVPGFLVSDYARRALPQPARIASAGDDRVFRYERFVVPLSWYGQMFGRDLLADVLEARSGGEIGRVLGAAGFTHFVVDRSSPIVSGAAPLESWIAREAFWEQDLRLEHASDGYFLFSLADLRGPRSRGPVLAERAMTLKPGGRETFEMRVVHDVLYVVDAVIRSSVEGAQAELAVAWIDGRGQIVGPVTKRVLRPEAVWQRRAVANAAPPGARRVRITILGGDGGPVEFAPIAFYALR
jgi:hypothetical protein